MSQERLKVDRAYRSLFLTDDGKLTPDGEIVMRDLEKACNWMVESMPIDKTGAVDPLRLAGIHDRRVVYSHIRKRLFEDLSRFIKATEKIDG